jgi:hypothetical protein
MEKWHIAKPATGAMNTVKLRFKKNGKAFGVIRKLPGMYLSGRQEKDAVGLYLVRFEINDMLAMSFGDEEHIVKIMLVGKLRKGKAFLQLLNSLNSKCLVMSHIAVPESLQAVNRKFGLVCHVLKKSTFIVL